MHSHSRAAEEPDDIDVRLVLAALLRDDDDALATAYRLNLPVEAVAAWRDVLVDAGYSALRPCIQPLGWVQAELVLEGGAEQYERLLESPLLDHMETWQQARQANSAWYLHKPPGVRLRVEGNIVTLAEMVRELLDHLAETGAVSGWRFGTYLPESVLFGGTVGTRLAHRFFTADSLAVMAHHRARLRRAARLGPAEFSLLLLHMCLAKLVPDRWERWDVWTRLQWTGRLLREDDPSAYVTKPGLDALDWITELHRFDGVPRGSLSPTEQVIICRYEARIEILAQQVGEAIERAELRENLRRLLPFWIVFHWNRMGFGLEAQRALAMLMVAALDPRGPAPE